MKICAFVTTHARPVQLISFLRTIHLQTLQPERLFVFLRGYTVKETAAVLEFMPKNERFVILHLPNYGKDKDSQALHYFEPFKDPAILGDYELFIRMDDDDLYPLDYIERVKEFHSKNTTVQYSYEKQCNCYIQKMRGFARLSINGPTVAFTRAALVRFVAEVIAKDTFRGSGLWEDTLFQRFCEANGMEVKERGINSILYIKHDTNTCH